MSFSEEEEQSAKDLLWSLGPKTKAKELRALLSKVDYPQKDIADFFMILVSSCPGYPNEITDILSTKILNINNIRGDSNMVTKGTVLEEIVYRYQLNFGDRNTLIEKMKYLIDKGVNINYTWTKSSYSPLGYGVMSMLRIQIPEEAKAIGLLLKHGYTYNTFKNSSFVDRYETWAFCGLYFRLFPYLVASQAKYKKVPSDFARILSTYLF